MCSTPAALTVVESVVDEPRDDYEHPGLFYLTVRAVSASGATVMASSSGVIVDVTVPLLVDAHVFRAGDSPERPTQFQKNNDSVSATWRFEDPESDVVEYSWQIGTTPGGDEVMAEESVGTSFVGHKAGLMLQDHAQYFVTVFAYNGAGLRAEYTPVNGTTVDPTLPDLDNASALPNGGNTTATYVPNLAAEVVLTTTRADVISLAWAGLRGTVEIIDWTLGTEAGLQDILPPTVVGPGPRYGGRQGWAEVRDGFLFVGEVNATDQQNLGPMADLAAVGRAAPLDVGLLADKLLLEPGVCVYHRLRAFTAAGASSAIHAMVCILDNGGSIITPLDGTLFADVDASGVSTGGRRRREAPQEPPFATLAADNVPADAALLIGPLSQEELRARYAGASSSMYIPYVSNPYTTLHLVTRSLLARRVTYMGLSLHVGLLQGVVLTEAATVTATLGPIATPGQIPAILFWDVSAGVWRELYDSCGVQPIVVPEQRTVSALLCRTRDVPDRVYGVPPRQPLAFFSLNTQLLLVSMDPGFVNTAPRVITESATVAEGGVLELDLEYIDDEGDLCELELVGPAVLQGAAMVSQGVLRYVPACSECALHTVSVHVVARERLQHEGQPLVSAVREVRIEVTPVNLPPRLLLVTGEPPASVFQAAPALLRLGNFRNTGEPIPLPIVAAVDESAVNLTVRDPSGTSGKFTWVSGAEKAGLQATLAAGYAETQRGASTKPATPLHLDVSRGWLLPAPGLTGRQEVRYYARDHQGAFSGILAVQFSLLPGCDNGGVLDPATGVCTCPSPFIGLFCEEDPRCHQAADCLPLAPCDASVVCVEGACIPKQAADGVSCVLGGGDASAICRLGKCIPGTTTMEPPPSTEPADSPEAASSALDLAVVGAAAGGGAALVLLLVMVAILRKR